jgi:beta-lactamase regulating signal transducer with metallopeptidase domain
MIANTISLLNELATTWWDVLVAVTWQAALLIVAAGLLCHFLNRQPPAARFWIWTIVAAKLLVMPFWSHTHRLPIPTPTETVVAASLPTVVPAAIEMTVNQPAPSSPPQVATPTTIVAAEPAAPIPAPTLAAWLMIGWAAIIVVHVIRIALQWRNLNRLLATGEPADASLRHVVERLSVRLGMRRSPEVVSVAEDVSPFVARAHRPVLVLPRRLINTIDLDGLEQIVLHELAHVRRGDLWWCWLPHVARLVYWFHPLVHWATYQANLERELACDAAAIKSSCSTVADYAHTLVHAASRATPLPALQAAVNQLVGE